MSDKNTITLKDLIAHCKEYGFVFQSSEIYDGLSAVYDYGPYGIELKRNLREYWWKAMVLMHENIVGLESAIFMHPKTWEASGHLEQFNDPMIDNKDSKKRYRADNLIEDHMDKIQGKIDKEVKKAAKKFGDDFDEAHFKQTHPQVQKYQQQIDELQDRFSKAMENNDLKDLKQIIEDYEIADPVSGTKNWTDVRQFNLMFSTDVGSTSEEASTLYLRPETAQGIYVNFLNVQKTSRKNLPFGIAQIGKSFRNEIVARQFIFRTREFEQMEMQFFVPPGEEMPWYEQWKAKRMQWHKTLGFTNDDIRFHDHDQLAHYANAAVDIEYDFPFGTKEVEGIHSRTDFDLSQHQEYSGKKLQYFDPDKNESYIPYVVETAIGLDRLVLAVISKAYENEDLGDGNSRAVLRFPPALAPVKVAILPLVRKDGLPEIGQDIYQELKYHFNCHYEEKDAIGKRYRRQDAIGTPYCITIDHQTKEDRTVTLRYRDSMEQKRIQIDELLAEMKELVQLESLLKQLDEK